MPNTTNFNWPTPADTDLVKDGAAAIRNLGNGIDTSLIDLKGGTTGQILSKASNADMDFTFITPNVGDITEVQAGTGISVASGTGPIPVVTNSMATEITAKGDLIVGTGSGTFDNLPVGTNGYTLVADSAQTTGLKWAAPSGSSFVGCSVDKSGVQSLANNTEVLITWDLENYDTDGFHSTVTNTGRMTIPSGKGGYYTVSGALAFDTDNTGMRYAVLYKNGAVFEYLSGGRAATGSGVNPFFALSITFSAVAGDYFEVYGFQNSGNSQNLSALSHFQISYLGA